MAANKYYEELYASGNMINATEGDSGIFYRHPKCRDLFLNHFPDLECNSVLELGAGEGQIFELIQKHIHNNYASYTLTESSQNAIKRLNDKFSKHKNTIVRELDVTARFPFTDNCFDIVCCFNLMHHITPAPAAQHMANEMMRVSKKHVFLIEANGISIIRRIGELPRQARELGESSYAPWKYKNFFLNAGAESVEITPWYFLMPPNIKKNHLKPFITVSEFGAKIPLLKWQSQSLEIYCEKAK